ncbi:MAG TPA: transcription antitermination factor NusB [Steroidobacteraceae bacterium]|nr:transcription antitermination factor NusB [Steroidobacteraceae bacterium]
MNGRQQMRALHARSAARRLAMQALYQSLLNEQPWQDLHQQFMASDEMARADPEYFRELIEQTAGQRLELDELIGGATDREVSRLDPIEHAILLLGTYELRSRLDVPFKVAISEGVDLARKFGAADGHKFVNAVLDQLAGRLRPAERDTTPT